MLERNARIGGGCSTDEPALPGYRFNLHSNFFMGFRHSPLMRDLELYRFGFSYVEPPVQQAAAFRDGTCVVIHKDVEATCASLGPLLQARRRDVPGAPSPLRRDDAPAVHLARVQRAAAAR